MLIYPAIDLYEGAAVRLYKGDYARRTLYSDRPLAVAADFAARGAKQLHLVDLEGARDGGTPNFELICAIKRETGLFCELGGGVRSAQTLEKYARAGLDRIILGTAAVTDPAFLRAAIADYGDRIAVGVDLRDGWVAIRGWTQTSARPAMDFCREMCALGVGTLVCTDISRDGALRGANHALYRQLSEIGALRVIASGGVSSLEDVRRLAALGLHGAIVGKACYTGAIDLGEAIALAEAGGVNP